MRSFSLYVKVMIKAVFVSAILASCGGGGSNDTAPPPSTEHPATPPQEPDGSGTSTPSPAPGEPGSTGTPTLEPNGETQNPSADTPPTSVPTHSGTGTFQPHTRLVDAFALQEAEMSDGLLVLRKPLSNAYAVGDVLVLDGLDGRLVRITGVENSANAYRYTYVLANLADAFETFDLDLEGALTSDDLGNVFDTNDPDFKIQWMSANQKNAIPKSLAKSSTSDDTLGIIFKMPETGAGINIEGDATFKLNPAINLHLARARPGDTLPELEFSASINPALHATGKIKTTASVEVEYSIGKKEFKFPPIRRIIIVPVLGVPTPIPVWVTPVLSISGAINGTTNGNLSSEYGRSQV